MDNLTEFNTKLRKSLTKIKDEGFSVTDICKLLFNSSTSQMARFIKQETEFGIKPITKIANQCGYTVSITVLKENDPDNEELTQVLQDRSETFFNDLYDNASKCLSKQYASNINGAHTKNTISRTTIDEILNELDL